MIIREDFEEKRVGLIRLRAEVLGKLSRQRLLRTTDYLLPHTPPPTFPRSKPPILPLVALLEAQVPQGRASYIYYQDITS